MAVAKQNINSEKIKHETRHLLKNRTTDFVQNPYNSKFNKLDYYLTNLLNFQSKQSPRSQTILCQANLALSENSNLLKLVKKRWNSNRNASIGYSSKSRCRGVLRRVRLFQDSAANGSKRRRRKSVGIAQNLYHSIRSCLMQAKRVVPSLSGKMTTGGWRRRTHFAGTFSFTGTCHLSTLTQQPSNNRTNESA